MDKFEGFCVIANQCEDEIDTEDLEHAAKRALDDYNSSSSSSSSSSSHDRRHLKSKGERTVYFALELDNCSKSGVEKDLRNEMESSSGTSGSRSRVSNV